MGIRDRVMRVKEVKPPDADTSGGGDVAKGGWEWKQKGLLGIA